MALEQQRTSSDTLWYKDAVMYELSVRAFRDSNGDGIGDFRGLIQKLDYLEELGVSVVWLLPFLQSPLRDDGYDISDYYHIHPGYGTMRDFRDFLRAAHGRGLRVIIELVLNHTSIDHPWFERARKSPEGSAYRDFYVWSDTPRKYSDTRVIFSDFESSNWNYDHATDRYYWHRFYSHQPDLNFDNPMVRTEMINIIDFWFEKGVDGIRLDGLPYLYEREQTDCENLPETHAFLKDIRRHVDERFEGKIILAEANLWPEDAASYFGKGDQCQMAFHFPLMPRLFMAVRMEDNFPVIDILQDTPPIPPSCQWILFLRNHDDLTLEMVTDQERDYMNKAYAHDPRMKVNLGIRRRLAPLLDNDFRKIEMMNVLLLSFPGTPALYYGDEIGMGDNFYLGDRNGVRTPMQWDAGKNAGFSEANPQRLYLPTIIDPIYRYEAINVESQKANLSSHLWWTKRALSMRKQYECFARGSFQFVPSTNPKALAFIRSLEHQTVLVVANLSRHVQSTSLDLKNYAGISPEEVFGRAHLPDIGDKPYDIVLAPYQYLWLNLEHRGRTVSALADHHTIVVKEDWRDIFRGKARKSLESILPTYLKQRRWFAGKGKVIRSVSIRDHLPLPGTDDTMVTFLQVSYTTGSDEMYILPLSFYSATDELPRSFEMEHLVVSWIDTGAARGTLYESIEQPDVHDQLLSLIARRKKLVGENGELIGMPGANFKSRERQESSGLQSRTLGAEQSNTSILFGDRYFMKLYRKLEPGGSPELEMVRHLTEHTSFRNLPLFFGSLEYRDKGQNELIEVGILQGLVGNQGDAWKLSTDAAGTYFEELLRRKDSLPLRPSLGGSAVARESMAGFFLEMASLLGTRTAQMHEALTDPRAPEAFRPDPFTGLYMRGLRQSLQSQVKRAMHRLAKAQSDLPEQIASGIAQEVLSLEQELLAALTVLTSEKYAALKIRIHGDFHLGQVLFTGKDFMIMDFEGEPARPLSERKLKYSCYRDVSGMLRSFHYAVFNALYLQRGFREEDRDFLEPWADPWYQQVSDRFLAAYHAVLTNSPLVPSDSRHQDDLLRMFLLEKAFYELGYELNNRPQWTVIPLKGILQVAHHLRTTAQEFHH